MTPVNYELARRKLSERTDVRRVLKNGLTEAERRYARSGAVSALGHLEGIIDYALLLLGDKDHWDSRAPKQDLGVS